MRLFMLSFLMVIPFLVAAQVKNASEVRTYSNVNFEIQYPATWVLDTSKTMGTELFLFSPLENAQDKFRENVNVLLQHFKGQESSLEKYQQITESQIANLAVEGKVYESVIKQAPAGRFYKVVYGMTQNGRRLKILSYCYIKNDLAFLVTFTADIIKYDQYQKTAEMILESFHLK